MKSRALAMTGGPLLSEIASGSQKFEEAVSRRGAKPPPSAKPTEETAIKEMEDVRDVRSKVAQALVGLRKEELATVEPPGGDDINLPYRSFQSHGKIAYYTPRLMLPTRHTVIVTDS